MQADPGRNDAMADGETGRAAAHWPLAGNAWWLPGALVVLAIVVIYGDTVRSMVALWRRSETYSHGFVVVPVVLWLLWRRRGALARLPVHPSWSALALVGAGGFVWLLGRVAEANVVQHFALVAIVVAAVVAVFGWAFARANAFALAFLVFAVPFGEAFVPQLIEWTANFTVAALKVSGIPVYREGNHFVIPTGRWSVVEACSGLRYLIAALMVGTLYAYLTYTSAWRRAAFIAASLVVPLVANWLRAYLIVMIGHLSGNELAVGVDHLIYGWVFFGFVVALMFWVGARFRDDAGASPSAPLPAAARSAAPAPRAASLVAVASTLAAAALWVPAADALLSAPATQYRPPAPIEGVAGWTPVDVPEPAWRPHFSGERSLLRQTFERGGRRVTVHVAHYAGGSGGREMIRSGNVLVAADDPLWRQTLRGRTKLVTSAGAIPARRARIVAPYRNVDVLWWYWVGGRRTDSEAVGKAMQAWSRLTRGSDVSAAVFVFTETDGPGAHEELLHAFIADMSGAIERSLRSTAALDGYAQADPGGGR
jgi:exosortase A